MARNKITNYEQSLLIPVTFSEQICPGTLEYTINHIADNHIDLSIFDNNYKNDKKGAPAYNPRILIKIILFAYSRGMYSSRKIVRLCRGNVIFKALSCDSNPDFTTISWFIRNMDTRVISMFSDILLVCYKMNLIGGNFLALYGCNFSSNASKKWSVTFAYPVFSSMSYSINLNIMRDKLQLFHSHEDCFKKIDCISPYVTSM